MCIKSTTGLRIFCLFPVLTALTAGTLAGCEVQQPKSIPEVPKKEGEGPTVAAGLKVIPPAGKEAEKATKPTTQTLVETLEKAVRQLKDFSEKIPPAKIEDPAALNAVKQVEATISKVRTHLQGQDPAISTDKALTELISTLASATGQLTELGEKLEKGSNHWENDLPKLERKWKSLADEVRTQTRLYQQLHTVQVMYERNLRDAAKNADDVAQELHKANAPAHLSTSNADPAVNFQERRRMLTSELKRSREIKDGCRRQLRDAIQKTSEALEKLNGLQVQLWRNEQFRNALHADGGSENTPVDPS